MPPPRTWFRKFADAFAGLAAGIRGQRSFAVHFTAAAAVIAAALLLGASRIEWCLLVLCIFAVLAAEMFNSALEELARAVDSRQNPVLGRALDIASAAVLLACLGAATVGVLVLGFRAGAKFGWWPD